MDTLAFGYILPTPGRIPDFHRLETCARRAHHEKICRREEQFSLRQMYYYTGFIQLCMMISA